MLSILFVLTVYIESLNNHSVYQPINNYIILLDANPYLKLKLSFRAPIKIAEHFIRSREFYLEKLIMEKMDLSLFTFVSFMAANCREGNSNF